MTARFEMIKTTKIETPIGEMVAAATSDGICLLEFTEGRDLSADFDELTKLLNKSVKKGWNLHLWRLRKQLKEYFKGKRKKFSIPLVTLGTEFQNEVWNGLKKIPYGSTISYQKQAETLNNPEAVRAVAQANSSNRIAIIIPCHRVIGSDRSLVGYRGGLQRKKWLIDHERQYSGQAVDQDLF
jgi:AraC family transcriptional regulator of adaptative response/methylated-DNA-[protein]-cysteine methyltransferase